MYIGIRDLARFKIDGEVIRGVIIECVQAILVHAPVSSRHGVFVRIPETIIGTLGMLVLFCQALGIFVTVGFLIQIGSEVIFRTFQA